MYTPMRIKLKLVIGIITEFFKQVLPNSIFTFDKPSAQS